MNGPCPIAHGPIGTENMDQGFRLCVRLACRTSARLGPDPGEAGGLLVVSFVCPRLARREQLGRHRRNCSWDLNPKTGSISNFTASSAPLSAALSMARVWGILMREPWPYGPPIHPVLITRGGHAKP